jgi:hypothetical protein
MKKPIQFSFNEEFELEHNNHVYYVEVNGTKAKDEYDYNSYYVEIEKIKIYDENNYLVTDSHSEYDEIVEEIINRDYDAEYEPECMDYLDDDIS